MFGVALLESSGVPYLVQLITRFLLKHGLDKRGLFEVVPNSSSLAALVAELTRIGEASAEDQRAKLQTLFSASEKLDGRASGSEADLVLDRQCSTSTASLGSRHSSGDVDDQWLIPGKPAFTVAGLLRYYLDHLPEPVIHSSLYARLVKLGSECQEAKSAVSEATGEALSSRARETMVLNELGMILRIGLPWSHLKTLQVIVMLLARVADNASVNSMSSTSLAVALGPALLRPPALATVTHTRFEPEYLLQIPAVVRIITLLIDHARQPGLFDVAAPSQALPAAELDSADASGDGDAADASATLEAEKARVKARAAAAVAAARPATESTKPQPKFNLSASQTRVFETWRSQRDAQFAAESDMARPSSVKQFALSLSVLGRRNVALGVDPVPLPLRVAFDYLENTGELLTTADLFDHDLVFIRGSIEAAVAELDASRKPQWTLADTDPHIPAGVVLHFFRHLPEALLPDSSHKLLSVALNALVLSASQATVPESPRSNTLDVNALGQIRSVIANLPPINVQVVRYMVDKLTSFLAAEESHGVTLERLAKVFGPLWFQGPPTSSSRASRTEAFALHSHTVVKVLLLLSDYILSPVEPPPPAPADQDHAVALTDLHRSIANHLQAVRQQMAR